MTLLSLLLQPALADDVFSDDGAHGFGIGAVIGEPTGLTLALRPNDYNAVQAHVTWSVVRDFAQGSVDYLQTALLIEPASTQVDIPLYVGIGGVLGVDSNSGNDTWLGVRIPLGVTVLPDNTPIEVFGEIVPTVYLLPETQAGLGGDIGVRVYF